MMLVSCNMMLGVQVVVASLEEGISEAQMLLQVFRALVYLCLIRCCSVPHPLPHLVLQCASPGAAVYLTHCLTLCLTHCLTWCCRTGL